jgi:hypothetical protein
VTPTILIIEDGDEYLESLRRCVVGPRYLQAHSAEEAVVFLQRGGIDLLYIDMRFDRLDHADLVGDYNAAAREQGDAARAWRWLEDNQGLFILDHLAERGWRETPAIIAYDFAREPRRFARLAGLYPRLAWVGDTAGAEEIRATMERLLPQR